VLSLILINNSITAKDIALILGITSRAVENYLMKLKEHEIIQREGSTKVGYWKIITKK